MRAHFLTLTAALSVLGIAASASAHSGFSTTPPVPNFASNSCNTCHDDTSGVDCPGDGPPHRDLNPFGVAFCNNGQSWSSTLSAIDSDGDGWTNGQELGDPFGFWTIGDTDPTYRGAPGDSGDEPSNFNLCNNSAYNDCTSTANGGTCNDSYNGSGRWDCGCDTPRQTGSSYQRTGSHDWGGGAGTVRYGYISFQADRCSDVNECAATTPPDCGVGSCQNFDGGYRCLCDGSMSEVCTMMSSGECTFCQLGCDTDNCDNIPDACVPTTSSPFFMCVCPVGYMGSGVGTSGCADINECATDPCGVGMCTQINPPGSDVDGYRCTCPIGYEAPASGGTCTNINECSDAPTYPPPYDGFDACSPGMCIEQAPGAFWSCMCPAATHELLTRGDGREVCDLNECLDPALSRCDANATCANTLGAWTCTCNPGYRGTGMVCMNIDECMEDLDTCDVNATCTDTDGSYMCACNAGYQGSGFSCVDINECAAGTHGCGINEMCVNNVGMPNDCVCLPGYSRPTPADPCMVVCGDGIRGSGEECDDGNTAVDDGCSDVCRIEPGWACVEPTMAASVCTETCGDGLVDTAEECDDGPLNDNTQSDACRETCRLPSCGDGTVDTGEACDDGASNSDTAVDGCRTTCDEAYCGDGVLDTGETCDSGGGLPGAAVAGQCTTLCFPDAGIDPNDPPVLTGGACDCRVGHRRRAPGGLAVLSLLGLLVVVARRRRR